MVLPYLFDSPLYTGYCHLEGWVPAKPLTLPPPMYQTPSESIEEHTTKGYEMIFTLKWNIIPTQKDKNSEEFRGNLNYDQ
jgi:hypothetical protein